jgi:hypothetical protein
MIKDVADAFAANGEEETRDMLEGLRDGARNVLELALSEAPEGSNNQNRYRYAREHVLPRLLGIEDPEERHAALDDVAEALKLKVKNLQRALSKMEGDLDEPEEGEEDDAEAASTAQADRLVHYALEETEALFKDQHDAPHALVGGEAVALNSRCYGWLRQLMWEREGRACRHEALSTAAGTLAAQAEFSGDVRELHTRAAWHEGKLYYELFPGTFVEVDGAGWRTVTGCPVLFRRIANLKPLPIPVPGGSLDRLEGFVNLRTERAKRLYKAYAATALLPHIPRPILLATGAMGAGKTTANRVIKRLGDPSAPESVRFDRDFLQKASHGYLLLLDNQSGLPAWAADQLCRLVTGEADSKRRLYTDDEDVIYELKRAILLNGINPPTDRGDVLDRSLAIELERIADDEVKPEKRLWEEFEAAHPRLLGAAFDVLSRALAIMPSIASTLAKRPRLADWGEYAAAVYEAMGWGADHFLEDWEDVVKVQNQATLDGSPVAQVIIRFMGGVDGEYSASSANLYKKLAEVAEDLGVTKDKEWPKSAGWLWRRIREVLTLLSAVGIEASRKEASDATIITLRKTSGDDATDATDAIGPAEGPSGGGGVQEGERSSEDDPLDGDDADGGGDDGEEPLKDGLGDAGEDVVDPDDEASGVWGDIGLPDIEPW